MIDKNQCAFNVCLAVLPVKYRSLHYEDVPVDVTASFTLREFNWPSFPFNWHYHAEVELTLIIRGQGLRFVGDSVEEFAEGDLCLLGANLPHSWASHKHAPASVRSLVAHFLPDSWGPAFWNLPEVRRIRDLLKRASRGLAVAGGTRREVEGLFHGLMEQPHSSLQRFQTLLEMLERIAGGTDSASLASADYSQPASLEANHKIGRILGYIHTRLGPELTQREVAQAAGLSAPAFSQFFKRCLRTSFVNYVNELKIRRASRRLLETDESVTDIAFASGFNNLSHFNTQFRRRLRQSPREYRRQAGAGGTPGAPSPAPEARPGQNPRVLPAIFKLDRDVTIHGRGTSFRGVRAAKDELRPWLRRYALCPALARHQILHAGITEAFAPYQIVRTNQTSSYFLACFCGRGQVLVEGHWRLIRPGMACLLPAHARNAFEALPGETWRFAYVCLAGMPRNDGAVLSRPVVVTQYDPDPLRLAILGLEAECSGDARNRQVKHWVDLIHDYATDFDAIGRT